MSTALSLISYLVAASVAVVLLMGLWNMARAGSPNTSQSLMRMRVILQFVAIIVLMGVLWFSGR